MFIKLIHLGILIAYVYADVQSGPYPPSGWRPQGKPFALPKEYLPPGRQNQNVQVEVSQEKVEYAGRSTTIVPNLPKNNYLPPTDAPEDATDEISTEDYLRVQGLPRKDQASFRQNGQLNQGEFAANRQNNFAKDQNNQRQLNSNQQQFGQVVTSKEPVAPSRPKDAEENPRNINKNKQQISTNDYDDNNDDDDDDDDDNGKENNNNQNAKNVANNYNGKGQYYILTPDNTLQRVVFMTSQNEEEAKINGFTAELRYMPVEPIRDPIYAYNEQGQLIRIFKK